MPILQVNYIDQVKDDFIKTISQAQVLKADELTALTNYLNKKQETFFMYIFYYFLDLFPGVKTTVFRSLALYGYLYMTAINSFDKLIDTVKQEKSAVQINYKLGYVCFEEAMKILCSVMPPTSRFWVSCREIKRRYFTGIELENQLSENEIVFTPELFNQLARYKHALSIIVIESLCHLSGDFQHRERLTESLFKLHTAFQLLDDIDDFRND
jgi:hypothetical protein